MISPITEQEQEESNGNSGEGDKRHTEEDTFRSFSAFVTQELNSVQPYRMENNQDNSQCTMLPFEGTECDSICIFFSAPCFSLQRVTGKQRVTNKQNKSYAALAERAARSGPSHHIRTQPPGASRPVKAVLIPSCS